MTASSTPTDRPTDPDTGAAARPDAVSRARATPLDLASVVASLVRPTTHRVVVEGRDPLDGQLRLDHRDVTVRPLLAELRAELVPGGESGGSGRGGGSPLSVDVADVLRDLERLGRVHLRLLRIRPRRGPGVDPIADGLAQLVPAHWPPELPAGLGRGAFRDRLAEVVDRGRAVLAGETTGTYVRDTRCPVCLVEWVTEAVPGGADRHPALRVNRAKPEPDGTPGPVRGTTCTACSRRWSWADMEAPGPPDWKPGKLWQLIAADRTVVAEARAALRRRAGELAARRRLYTDTDRPTAEALGLPIYEPEEADA